MLAPIGFGKRLHPLHELGVLDLVERPGPAGELHARLQLAVAAPRGGRFPRAGLAVEPFDDDELAADMALRRQVGEDDVAADRRVDA